MKYMGGKARFRKPIASILNRAIIEHKADGYLEPFCGACWVTIEVDSAVKRVACDTHEDLILVWQALQEGWIPPAYISEEEYKWLKHSEPSALRGFAGFCCSFGGHWFGGYARQSKPSEIIKGMVFEEHRFRGMGTPARAGWNSLYDKIKLMGDVHFIGRDYKETPPLKNWVIYCDPPYADTEGYQGVPPLDHNEFWQWAEHMARRNWVFVSEYNAPEGCRDALKIETICGLNRTVKKKDSAIRRVEKLFTI